MARIDLESVLTAMIGNRGKAPQGRANFNLIRPVNPRGGTEESYGGQRVPLVSPGRSSNINLTDPQTGFQRMQGDGIKTLGGYTGDTAATEPQMTVGGTPMDDLVQNPEDKEKAKAKMKSLIGGIGDIGSSLAQSFGDGRSPKESNLLAKYFGGFRANGGPMKKGKAYMVGEEGPELVVAEEDSTVIPRPQIERTVDPTGNLSINVDETITPDNTTAPPKQSVAEKLKAELDRRQSKDFKKGGKDRDKDHNIMDVIRSIGLGALKGIAGGRGGSLESILGNALGGAAGGGVAGAVDASADEKMGNEMAIAKLQPQYNQAAKSEADARESKLAEEWRRKQIENVDVDNKLNAIRVGNATTNAALKQLTGLKHYDPNNPAHVAVAKAAKIDPATLAGWDDRKPFTKEVAGRTYVYNGTSKSFEPSNLPTNDAKTIVDFVVQVPTMDGGSEMRTYKVPQTDAARFSAQMAALGYQAEQRAKAAEKAAAESVNQLRIKDEMKRVADQWELENDPVKKLAAKKLADQLLKAYEEDLPWNATGEAIPNQK